MLVRIFVLLFFFSSCIIHKESRIDTPAVDVTENVDRLIPGKLYTAKELATWKHRAVYGPFKVQGDIYTESSAEYTTIKGKEARFLITPDNEIILPGKGVPIVADDATSMYDWSEFGFFHDARDAAFVDLVEEASTHNSRLKSLLLSQAQEVNMDFSNRTLFPYDNKDAVWLYAEWMHSVFKMYDYLDDSLFSISEKNIIDNWFKSAADWFNYILTVRSMNQLYTVRSPILENSVVDFGHWANDGVGTQRYKGSIYFHAPGSWINNRQLGMANFVTHVGVKYNIDEWKSTGAQLVKEYVSFSFDDEGYYAELNRSTTSTPYYGIAYGGNSLTNIAQISHILYHDGYENLYEYKSNATIDPSTGDIKIGSVTKSLKWVLLKFRENFMIPTSPAIYPLGNTVEDSTQVIHFCNNTLPAAQTIVGRMYSGSAIINLYYKNKQIEEMYLSPNGNMCGFSNAIQSTREGPNGIAPGFLFQYVQPLGIN